MKNGLYLTAKDFPNFNNEIDKQIDAYNQMNEIEVRKDREKQHCQNITFVVTEQCNLNCTYCYETHKTNRVMTKEIAKQAVDMILDKELVNGYYDTDYTNAVILEFIGGEPFLNIDVIDYTVEYFKYRTLELNHPWGENYMISITSNGILYFDEKVQDFLKRNEGRVSLGITIDGNKELHDKCRLFHDGRGSYDIVEKAVIDWNKKYPVNTQTKITLAPENVMYLNDAIRNLEKLGIEGAFTNCCFEEGWTVDDAKILYSEMIKLADYIIDNDKYTKLYCSLFDETIGEKNEEPDKNWCGGNGDMLAIGTDGKCYPCIRFMQYSLNNQVERPIGDIWRGLDNPKFNCFLCALQEIDMITQCQYPDNQKCLTCPISQGCGLCTGYNYDRFGDANHKATFICDMHRARVLANVYFWNKLYEKLGIDKVFPLNLDKETALRIISEEEFSFLQELTERR